MHSTFLTLLASVAIAAVCQGESYFLNLNRPEKVGDRAEITAKGTDRMSHKLRQDGEIISEGETFGSCSLDAVREVLAVNNKGRPVKLKFTVRSLMYTADKEAPAQGDSDRRQGGHRSEAG